MLDVQQATPKLIQILDTRLAERFPSTYINILVNSAVSHHR